MGKKPQLFGSSLGMPQRSPSADKGPPICFKVGGVFLSKSWVPGCVSFSRKLRVAKMRIRRLRWGSVAQNANPQATLRFFGNHHLGLEGPGGVDFPARPRQPRGRAALAQSNADATPCAPLAPCASASARARRGAAAVPTRPEIPRQPRRRMRLGGRVWWRFLPFFHGLVAVQVHVLHRRGGA